MKICISANHMLWSAALGGHAWVFLNWALGLQARGCDITVLEKAGRRKEPSILRERLAALGLHAGICFLPEDDASDTSPPGVKPFDSVVAETDLFLNFRYTLSREIVSRFRRSALVDIDPGLLQMWIHGGNIAPARHDIYFSVGETVGQPGARFPDCGIRWHFIPPPVYLPAWPVTKAPDAAPYTTVTNWWGEYEVFDGKMINNEKRTNFIEFMELPSRTQATLELAIYQEQDNNPDIPMLNAYGWRTRPASEVSGTADEYRRYIQRSRGEFSCVKQSCIHLANAWMSDRTICYLASGKPAVIQHTGPSRFLPDAEGLFRFRNLQEAADHLAAAEADHDHHGRRARALVEEHFDAEKLMGRMLSRALSVKARGAKHP